jgi:hypothetical protein
MYLIPLNMLVGLVSGSIAASYFGNDVLTFALIGLLIGLCMGSLGYLARKS